MGDQFYEPKVEVVTATEKDVEAFWARLEQEAMGAQAMESSDPAEVLESAGVSGPDAAPMPEGEALSYEDRLEALLRIVNNRPSHREILLRVLSFCIEEKEFGVVEDEIQSYPEFEYAAQNPYRLIKYLLDGEGLEMLEIGFDGMPVSDEQKEGLTEDEIDDLIDCFHLRTTDLGRDVAQEFSPERRMKSIFSLFPDRGQFYT